MSEPQRQTLISGEILSSIRRTNDIACEAVAANQPGRLTDVYTTDARILPPGLRW